MRLDDQERSWICIRTLCSLSTIDNYALGYAVTNPNRMRIEREIKRQGIERKERERAAGHGRRRRIAAPPKPLHSEIAQAAPAAPQQQVA